MINKICPTCKINFSVRDSFARIKFCSHKCVRFSDKIKKKLSDQRSGIPKTKTWKTSASKGRLSEKNPQWKGGRAGLQAIHIWVRARKPKPNKCIDCQKNPPVDLANISQKYKRDINDFEWLCRKCHMTKDGRLKALIKSSK